MSISWSRLWPRVPAHSPLAQPQPRLVATRQVLPSFASHQRRQLLTLAIESSCDDTCVALLEKTASGAARLHFNKKITSDNREFQGVHPLTAIVSHTAHLAPLIKEALRHLPEALPPPLHNGNRRDDGQYWKRLVWEDGKARQKPDYITVTRGPGMTSNLAAGLNTAKGLATAWDVPLLGVNHMQAHALTPRLVSALEQHQREEEQTTGQGHCHPRFPFLSLLVSGGHTILVHSLSLCDHRIVAEAMNIATGDMIDKCARVIIPPEEIATEQNVMYGPLLEKFAFPQCKDSEETDYEYTPPLTRADEIKAFDSGLGWVLTPPLSGTTAMAYDFAGIGGRVRSVVEEKPEMSVDERRLLARHTMRLVFEHLASRLLFALKNDPNMADVKTVVVAGGVASNRYLMHILRSMLQVRGFGHLEIIAPPPALCTDNAAMIAWTGMEMYEAGFRSEMDILPIKKWPLGGILTTGGWIKRAWVEQDKAKR
ncbi:glycoprotease family-domain-containing protein [Pseudomassariella vexata]|uniref:Glycoprotease family-domain-containing protein n=1 Tax=Pseudomassariella vexata TaxID=1141098 RepID=A0A1Y2E422_9PEZI|nr:glycoprotease family-domain-containing protein [Pseudomassariella vexata]ORY66303.1 glycoprotease family-domain-containing protein [Pseudomassariella vexata]